LFRRSGPRDEPADERAMAARDAATQAFLALDDEQRAVAESVRAAEELEIAPGLAEAWREVAAIGDAATEAYLSATADRPTSGSHAASVAHAADERALREIQRARDTIRRFRDSHSRPLGEAAYVRTNVPRMVQQARTALTEARTAVEAAEAAGTRSRRAAERLAEAARAAERLENPGARLRERLQAAEHTLELARSAATLAAEAPGTAEAVRTALRSIATRRSAAATKAERIQPALSALRREFSDPCSRDLTGAETHAHEAIAEADRAITAARRLATDGHWDEAADQIAAARSALGRAEEHHDLVTDRLSLLRDVRADPGQQAADARFVLRDAQRLVVDRGLVAEFGPVLDAQSVRLANAQERLTGAHPDYWLYLTELRGVCDRVKDVVTRARSTSPRR
jgi:chromosome segregation ATPase